MDSKRVFFRSHEFFLLRLCSFFLCVFSLGFVSYPVGNWLIQKGHDRKTTLPETNIAPENQWLEVGSWEMNFFLGWPIFTC